MDEMDLLLAQNLVSDAIRTVLGPRDTPYEAVENYHVTLRSIGLQEQEHRDLFAAVLLHRVRQAGFQIDLNDILREPDDTLFRVASALPGHSTKSNTP